MKTMEFDHDILKDLIAEKYPGINREYIHIEDVWSLDAQDPISDHPLGVQYIIADFAVSSPLEQKLQHYEQNIPYSEYEQRLRVKLRSEKLNGLGI